MFSSSKGEGSECHCPQKHSKQLHFNSLSFLSFRSVLFASIPSSVLCPPLRLLSLSSWGLSCILLSLSSVELPFISPLLSQSLSPSLAQSGPLLTKQLQKYSVNLETNTQLNETLCYGQPIMGQSLWPVARPRLPSLPQVRRASRFPTCELSTATVYLNPCAH